MFTGIIEEIGTIREVRSGKLKISASTVLEGTKVGDSIAVNGVCLTATSIDGNSFTADVMPETLRRSNLGELHSGSKVNLERAAAVGSRLGGHIVSGHIDGISLTVAEVTDENFSVSLIPHTSEVTTLLSKRVGEVVNLENDVIGKYVKKLMGKSEKKGITLEFLAENGF